MYVVVLNECNMIRYLRLYFIFNLILYCYALKNHHGSIFCLFALQVRIDYVFDLNLVIVPNGLVFDK